MDDIESVIASECDLETKLCALECVLPDNEIENENFENLRTILDRLTDRYICAKSEAETKFCDIAIKKLFKRKLIFEGYLTDKKLSAWLSWPFNSDNLISFFHVCHSLQGLDISSYDDVFKKVMSFEKLTDTQKKDILHSLLIHVLDHPNLYLRFKKILITVTDRFLNATNENELALGWSLLNLLVGKPELLSCCVEEMHLNNWLTNPELGPLQVIKLLELFGSVKGMRITLIPVLKSSAVPFLQNTNDARVLFEFLNYIYGFGDFGYWHKQMVTNFVDAVVDTAIRVCVNNMDDFMEYINEKNLLYTMLDHFWMASSYFWQLERYLLLFRLLNDGDRLPPTALYVISTYIPSASINYMTTDILSNCQYDFDDHGLALALKRMFEWCQCFGTDYSADINDRLISLATAYENVEKHHILVKFAEINFEKLVSETLEKYALYPLLDYFLIRYPGLVFKFPACVIELLNKLKKKKVPTATLR